MILPILFLIHLALPLKSLAFSIDPTGRFYSDLFSTNNPNFTSEISKWTHLGEITPQASQCSGTFVLGSSNHPSQHARVYNNLPNHEIMAITFRIFLYGMWEPKDYVSVKIANKSYQITTGSSIHNAEYADCGDKGIVPVIEMIYKVLLFHNESEVGFVISGHYSEEKTNIFYGIREIEMSIGLQTDDISQYSCVISPQGYNLPQMCKCQDRNKYFDPITETCLRCPFGSLGGCTDGSSTFIMSCKQGFHLTGISCGSCPSNCAICNSKQCLTCSQGYYKNSNEECQTCPEPMEIIDGLCISKCPQGQYLYTNKSCHRSCELPYKRIPIGNDLLCDKPCPMAENNEKSDCISNCEGSYELKDGTCTSSCPNPFSISTHPNLKCQTPCLDPSKYLYPDKSCRSECLFPMIPKSSPYPYCQSPCEHEQYFNNLTKKCQNDCEPPMRSIITEYYAICYDYRPYRTIYAEGSEFLVRQLTIEQNGPLGNVTSSSLTDIHTTSISAAMIIQRVATILSTITGAAGASSAPDFNLNKGLSFSGAAFVASAFTMAPMARFIYYTRFFDVSYPRNLREFYLQTNHTSLQLEIPIPLVDGVEMVNISLPENFKDWGFKNTFLANYWETLLAIPISLAIGLLFWVGEKIAKYGYYKELTFFFSEVKFTFKWNLALTIFLASADMIILYTFFQLSNPISLGEDGVLASFILAIISLVLLVFLVGMGFKLARNSYHEFHEVAPENVSDENVATSKFNVKWKSFKILFAGFEDHTFLGSTYVMVSLIRNIIWILIIVCLIEFPIGQTPAICALNIVMIVYIFVKKPFQNLLTKVQMISLEIISLFIHSSILGIVVISQNNPSSSAKELLGTFVLIGATVYSVIAFIGFLAHFILGIVNCCKIYRSLKAENKTGCEYIIGLPFMSKAKVANNNFSSVPQSPKVYPLPSKSEITDPVEKPKSVAEIRKFVRNSKHSVTISEGTLPRTIAGTNGLVRNTKRLTSRIISHEDTENPKKKERDLKSMKSLGTLNHLETVNTLTDESPRPLVRKEIYRTQTSIKIEENLHNTERPKEKEKQVETETDELKGDGVVKKDENIDDWFA